MKSIDGVLIINKPPGLTSNDVIIKVRRLLQIKKIGHTGTLDPLVDGVLPLCIGRGTKVVEYLQERPKTYIAEWTGGTATDTEDQSGDVIEKLEHVSITKDDVERAFYSFLGEYDQTPPMYSAVKVSGRRLYDLAREGKVVERQSRKVEIYDMDLLEMDLDRPDPKVKFRVKCSKGTYIRTLCVDIGRALHIPAHMSKLTRIETAGFTLEHAVTLEQLETAVQQNDWEQYIVPIEQAIPFFPAVQVPDFMDQRIMNGQPIRPRFPLPKHIEDGTLVRIESMTGKLLALHQVVNSAETWSKPVKILSIAE